MINSPLGRTAGSYSLPIHNSCSCPWCLHGEVHGRFLQKNIRTGGTSPVLDEVCCAVLDEHTTQTQVSILHVYHIINNHAKSQLQSGRSLTLKGTLFYSRGGGGSASHGKQIVQ